MILRHCRNCGEPMRRIAGDEDAMRCIACAPRETSYRRPVVVVSTPPAAEIDPSVLVARRAVETAQLLASLAPGEGGMHEGEARVLAEMASGDRAVLRRAMKIALAQKDSVVSTMAGALLFHAYEVAAGLHLR